MYFMYYSVHFRRSNFFDIKKKDQISFASPSFSLLIIHYRRCIITRERICNADSYLEDNIIFNHTYFFHVLLHALYALQFLTLDILILKKKKKTYTKIILCFLYYTIQAYTAQIVIQSYTNEDLTSQCH